MNSSYGEWWDYTPAGMIYNWWTSDDPATLQKAQAEAAQRGDIAEVQRIQAELDNQIASQITFGPGPQPHSNVPQVGTAGIQTYVAPQVGVGNIGTAAPPPQVRGAPQAQGANGRPGPSPLALAGYAVLGVVVIGAFGALAKAGGGRRRRRRR
jgi:PPE-repeat protein